MTAESLTPYTPETAGSDLERLRAGAEASVRSRIVALFEKHRATPGTPWDEERFVDFLMPSRERWGALDGFRAQQRLNDFIDAVQYEFAICFPARERRANGSLQGFVKRVVELRRFRHPLPWPRSWKNQLTAGTEWALTLLADLVLLVGAVLMKNHEWALGAIGCLAFLINAWFLGFAWRATAYLERLRARIEIADRNGLRLRGRIVIRRTTSPGPPSAPAVVSVRVAPLRPRFLRERARRWSGPPRV